MKNVGIIAYHYAVNFGAVMQVYALRRTIKELTGYEVQIINYKPSGFQNKDEDIRDAEYCKQKSKVDEFLQTHCSVFGEPTSSIHQIPEFDYYITGSDQVWNPELPVFEETEEYFLNFVPDDKVKISYAASIGVPITENFSTKLFEKNIPRFDYLSIREQSYVPFIEQFTNKKCHAVFDPTLLLSAKEYESLIPQKECDNDFILCVPYDKSVKRRILDLANMYSIMKNYNVVHMEKRITSYLFLNEEETIRYADPREILWTIKNAKMIITDSFHFMVFAIIFRKPFWATIKGLRNARQVDLLTYLGLEDRILSDDVQLMDLEREIDYNEVERRIEEKKSLSIEFLRMALGVDK